MLSCLSIGLSLMRWIYSVLASNSSSYNLFKPSAFSEIKNRDLLEHSWFFLLRFVINRVYTLLVSTIGTKGNKNEKIC